MITLQKLRYFLQAVDCGTLSAAAFALGVSQPTLSQQLASLESHLQRKLLVRGPFGVAVTAAGRQFYRHARALASQIELAEADVEAISGENADPVSLGLATCSAASSLALPVLRTIRNEHPNLRLRLFDNFAGKLSDLIMTGRIDLALAYTGAAIPGLTAKHLFNEELCLAISGSMKLFPEGTGSVHISSVRDLPAILVSSVHLLRGVIDRGCFACGFEPRVLAELDSTSAILSGVAAGIGYTILPRAALRACEPSVNLYPLIPKLCATVSLCSSAHLPSTTSIEAVREVVEHLVDERVAADSWPDVARYVQ